MKQALQHLVDRHWVDRLLQAIPGLLTWTFLLLPIVLSLTAPLAVAYFIIAFDLFWLIKSFRLSFYLIRGYRRMQANQQINWNERLDDLEDLDAAVERIERQIDYLVDHHPRAIKRFPLDPKAVAARIKYLRLVKQLDEFVALQEKRTTLLRPSDLYNVVIMATYNESRAILEPSIRALLEVEYPLKQMMFVLAYEERGGADTEETALAMIEKYGSRFAYAAAIKHPDGIPGEVIGKGGNISFAAREFTKYVHEQQIDPNKMIVTTLDADHRAHPQYFANLSYLYASDVNRTRRSYQPVAMFTNNIWDAPAPMRVIATGNSFWNMVESMRPHRLRNFAAHAQGLQTLIDTDYWSVTTIVEDGHQYWRTYFTYDGDHKVIPLMSPIYQDAVLAEGYLRTFKVQYLQLRRWAWGVSDFSYVVRNMIKNKHIPWSEKIIQISRLFEGHFSWATAPLVLTFVASLPVFLNQEFAKHNLLAYQLPVYASRIMTVAMIGLVINILISWWSLPPKPERYRQTKMISMIAQWALLPFTAIAFSSLAAIDAQTRLIFGKSLDFIVTEKATKGDYIIEEIS